MSHHHPLPWTMSDRDWVHLEPESAVHEGEPKPYKLRFGPKGFEPGPTSHSAAFTEAELRALRDQIDAVLDAPYRVLILGGHGLTRADVEEAIRTRLDLLHSYHPRMEVATRCQFTPADEVAERWANEADVPLLFWGDAESMVADGGNRALIVMVAGAHEGDTWDENVLASQARICADWVSLHRRAPKVVPS